MGWQTVATVLIVVFAIVLTQSVLAGPFAETLTGFSDSGDYANEHYDGNDLIEGWITDWFNMGLIAIFGILAWGVWRVLRRELTRGGI